MSEEFGKAPAFPEGYGCASGMTYRQWLIGMALTGYCASCGKDEDSSRIAELSISDADAVIEALDKEA